MFIISFKKVGLQFPRHDTAIALKDHVFGEVYKAINTLDCIFKNINSSPDKRSSINSTQTAATSLKKLEVNTQFPYFSANCATTKQVTFF